LKAEGAIPEQVIIQTGVGGHRPEGLDVVETLPFDKVQALLRDASIVVCHGGTGSLITALRQGCQVISMPRLAELGEHYDDHQAQITEAFVARGLVLTANTVDELRAALEQARTRKPVLATTDPVHLQEFLRGLLAELD
jgi:UDP-N-acetylglucosamine--N-acetylmuramyl-(pentapeptide) pyrophosphoryl-undecaprenol N-acetylglucosamine transferase